MTLFIVGNLLGQLGDEVWPFWTGADKSHLPAQDIPKLWDFINANLADYSSDSRRAIVVLAGPHRPVFFSIDSHRTKLRQDKRLSILSYSLLLVENGATRFELNENRGKYHDRK